MIKALILDVDGVIVGKKSGFNFPNPHEKVIKALKAIRSNGIPVILCTGKFNYAIKEIIHLANLANPHIADGGSLIIDPINNIIIKKAIIPGKIAEEIIKDFQSHKIFTEIYSPEDYFMEKNQDSEIIKKREAILQKKGRIVDSFSDLDIDNIIKILLVLKNAEEKERVKKALEKFKDEINFILSFHPSTLPLEYCIITVKGVSKRNAAIDAAKYLNISFENFLGVGDGMADWEFMQICKYAATMKDANGELKKLVKEKGEKFSFIADSVDDHGMLQILKRFKSELMSS